MYRTVLIIAILFTVVACTQSPDENDVVVQATSLPASATPTPIEESVPWTGVIMPTTGPILASTPTPTPTPEPNTSIRYIHNDGSAYLYEFRNQYCYASQDISPLAIYRDGESVFEKMRPLILRSGYVLFDRTHLAYDNSGEEVAEYEIWRFEPKSKKWWLLVNSSTMFSLLEGSPRGVNRFGNYLSVFKIVPAGNPSFTVFNTAGFIEYSIDFVSDLRRLDVETGKIDTILTSEGGGIPFLSPDASYLFITSYSHVKILDLSSWSVESSLNFQEVKDHHYPYTPMPFWKENGIGPIFVTHELDENLRSTMNVWRFDEENRKFIQIARKPLGQIEYVDWNRAFSVSESGKSILFFDFSMSRGYSGITINLLDTDSGESRIVFKHAEPITEFDTKIEFLSGNEDWYYYVDGKYYVSMDGADPVQGDYPGHFLNTQVAVIPDYESCIEP